MSKFTSTSIISAVSIIAVIILIGQVLTTDYEITINPSLLSLKSILPTFWSKLIAAIFFLLSLFILVRIAGQHKIPDSRSINFYLFPLIVTCVEPTLVMSLEQLLVLFLVLLMLRELLKIHKQRNVLKELLLASLFLGIASLFYLPALFLLIIPVLAVLLFRSFELRNYIIVLLGLSIPYFYYFGTLYLFEIPYPILFFEISLPSIEVMSVSWRDITISTVLFLVGIIATFYTLSQQPTVVVRKRNQLNLLLVVLISALLLSCFFFEDRFPLLLLAFGSSFFFAWFYKDFSRKWILDLFFLLCLTLIIWNNWLEF